VINHAKGKQQAGAGDVRPIEAWTRGASACQAEFDRGSSLSPRDSGPLGFGMLDSARRYPA